MESLADWLKREKVPGITGIDTRELTKVLREHGVMMGKMEWIEKYLHVKKKSLDKAERFMAGRGAWMGFFAFLPLLGSAITNAVIFLFFIFSPSSISQ